VRISFCTAVIVLFAGLLLSGSCRRDARVSRSTGHLRMTDDTLVRYNQERMKAEDREIMDFLARYGWKVQVSPTGLRSMIYRHGNGKKVKKGDRVVIGYEIRLISGDLVYSSERDGEREIKAGYSETERGLDEGILMMRVGDRAKFIVPSHLAFGLLGDQKKIPPGATLLYDVELKELK